MDLHTTKIICGNCGILEDVGWTLPNNTTSQVYYLCSNCTYPDMEAKFRNTTPRLKYYNHNSIRCGKRITELRSSIENVGKEKP